MHEPTANMNLWDKKGKLVHDRFDTIVHDDKLGLINLRIDHGDFNERDFSTL